MPRFFASLLALALLALPATAQTTAIVGTTLIDGRGAPPVSPATILIADGRIQAVGLSVSVRVPAGARRIDGAGKYVIPGLMDANVHLVFGISLEFLARYEGRFEPLVEEAAQVALKNGLTTVFDSWGPLAPLVEARDRIARGEVPGARMFVAGNIIGLTGPLGRDFNGGGETEGTKPFVKRINDLWELGTGPRLMWLTPDSLGVELRRYAEGPENFLKYAVSGHTMMEMLMFSPEQQRVIVEEGHRAGKVVQTHTTSIESVRQAIEAGVDLMQHCSIAGITPMPDAIIRLMIERKVWCAVQPTTARYREAQVKTAGRFPPRVPWVGLLRTADQNERRLIAAHAPLLLATDAGITDPDAWAVLPDDQKVDNSTELGPAHFTWFDAMAEKGMAPMDMILAATRNIAMAYHVIDDFGTLEPGKRADLLLLEADPLANIANVRKIAMVMKDGAVVDREALPLHPMLTVPRS
jgi:imidazolonepropionase-like amidohydrolase